METTVSIKTRIEPASAGVHFSSAGDQRWGGLPMYMVTGPDSGVSREQVYPAYTLHLLVRGACSIELAAGRKNFSLNSKRGMFSGYPAGVQWDRCAWNGQVSVLGLHITDDAMGSWTPELRDRWLNRSASTFRADRDKQIELLMLALHDECSQGSPMGSLYAESLSMALICRLAGLRAQSGEGRKNAPVFSLALRTRVLDYINANLDTDLTIKVLAKLIPCSPNHFAAMFKATFSATVHQFVVAQRIKRARALLDLRRHPSLVAIECGFSSQSHFTSAFRQAMGCTPGKYQGGAEPPAPLHVDYLNSDRSMLSAIRR